METPTTLSSRHRGSSPTRIGAISIWSNVAVAGQQRDVSDLRRGRPPHLAKSAPVQVPHRSAHPRRQFSVKVGTIFEDSPIPLSKWLLASWQIGNYRNGISRHWSWHIGVTQKSCVVHEPPNPSGDAGRERRQAGGEVEVDETFIGGKGRNMHRDKRARVLRGRSGQFGKVAVMGLLARHERKGHSKVRTMVVPNTKRHHLQGQIERNVEDGSKVYTDSLPSYDRLGLYFQHEMVDHAETYVDGQVHTNGLENYWSLLKRSIQERKSALSRSTCSVIWTSRRSASMTVACRMRSGSRTFCATSSAIA